MATVIGPDVSFYQDNPGTSRQIDFTKMKESAGYVIIRAGQNLWIDFRLRVQLVQRQGGWSTPRLLLVL